MRAAAVQLNSNGDRSRNMERADSLAREAAADGAELIVLPEKFTALGAHDHLVAAAEQLDGPTLEWASALATEFKIDVVAGSFVEKIQGADKLANTSIHVGPDGELKAVYRKIHMFDVVVGGQEYRESDSEDPGEEIVTSTAADGTGLGLTVCYDLRFPELFRILAIRGARVITLPAAFTKVTGAAHWEILVRARAIENQAFVVAADQTGASPPDKLSYGGSMIVDPWGEVLARMEEGEGFIAADLDLSRLEEVREQLPSLANRRPDAYEWPQGATA